MSALNSIHPNMQFYILRLLWNWKDDKASCFCALCRATTAGDLTPLTQFHGSTRISRERVGIQPHTIAPPPPPPPPPPPNGHTPKQPCFWTRTTQIKHTIYLVIKNSIFRKFISIFFIWQAIKTRLMLTLKRIICDILHVYTLIFAYIFNHCCISSNLYSWYTCLEQSTSYILTDYHLKAVEWFY